MSASTTSRHASDPHRLREVVRERASERGRDIAIAVTDRAADLLDDVRHEGGHRAGYRPRRALPWGPVAIAASGALLTAATGFAPLALGESFRTNLGWSDPWIGRLVGVYALGLAMSALVTTVRIRLGDPRLLLVVGLLVSACAGIATVLGTTPYWLLLTRLGGGIGAGIAWTALLRYCSRVVVESLADRTLVAALATVPGSLLAMPLLATLATRIGWRGTLFVLAALTLVVAAAAARRLPYVPLPLDVDDSLATPDARPLLGAVLALACGQSLALVALPALLGDRPDIASVGVLLGLGIAGTTGAWAGTHASRPTPRAIMVTIVALAVALELTGILDSLPMPLAWVLVMVWGCCAGATGAVVGRRVREAFASKPAATLPVVAGGLGIAVATEVGAWLVDARLELGLAWLAAGLAAVGAFLLTRTPSVD